MSRVKPFGERGQVLVLFALGLFVLFGAVALGIDGSRTFEERRAAQIAADHAATAAAYASCTGGTVTAAQAAGRAAARSNGFDDAAVTIDVEINPVATHTFQATVRSTIEGTFARVISIQTFSVGVEATAQGLGCGTTSSGSLPGAIFAGGTCPSGKYALDVSGSTDTVIGGVHSNGDASVGGSSNRFTEPGLPDDPFTYVGSISQGSGNFYQTPPYPAAVVAKPWPTGFDPSLASPDSTNDAFWNTWSDRAVADGHGSLVATKITSIPSNGVYYTSHVDGMDISSINGSVTSFTLVARNGPIKVSASTRTFNPDADAGGILMLSGMVQPAGADRCDKYTISVSGSGSTWNGVLWAPGGLIELAGSDNTAVNGSLVGWAVRLNGSNLTVRFTAVTAMSSSIPIVLLVE